VSADSPNEAADRIPQDRHADRRLNDIDVDLYSAGQYSPSLVTLDVEGIHVMACVDHDASGSAIHEAFAAVAHQAMLAVAFEDLDHGGESDRTAEEES